jgi:hypothetical protein
VPTRRFIVGSDDDDDDDDEVGSEDKQIGQKGRPRNSKAVKRLRKGEFAKKEEAMAAGKEHVGTDSKRKSGNASTYAAYCSRHLGCEVRTASDCRCESHLFLGNCRSAF